MDESLQSAERRDGKISDLLLHVKETTLANQIRNKMTINTLSTIQTSADYMRGDALNADMPGHIRFSSLEDRIAHMAISTSQVGNFEIVRTAETIKKQIIISCNNATLTIGEQYQDAIHLAYTSFGDNTGHYDTIIKMPMPTPVQNVGRVLSPSIQRKIPVLPSTPRKRSKGESSEVLTSTPYKTALEEKAASRAKRQKGEQSVKKNSVNKRKKKQKTANARPKNVTQAQDSDVSDWYCFMCNECRLEDMVQCSQCKSWAHEDCAGTVDATFMCELCN